MTSKKRKPLRREVRCLYLALLKESATVLDLRKMIGFYEDYNDLRSRVISSAEAPSTLKVSLPPLKMPKYLKWVKQYLV